ncbi:hypothetical protein AAW01_05360 [Aurantiacibacter gangjinensis]|uniref:HTH tetR-type domain-containing protein n=1 Tax=Aurantiacibacter gangjinensis TaxID=502682 RepID=A0A0G9MVQ3_9SPHN|nr:hypothetical protein AAW01_05360 [Aurantiacibacter gangjinensis]
MEEQTLRRRQVAQCALRVFMERGYAGASMSEVARRAEISKASLYHHFTSKEDMLVQALTVDTGDALSALERLAMDRETPAEHRLLEAFGYAHDAILSGSMGRLLTVLAQAGRDVPEIARGFHEKVIVRFRSALVSIYADAIADGTFRDLTPREMEQVIVGPLLSISLTSSLVQNATELHASNLSGTDRDSYVALMTKLLRKE